MPFANVLRQHLSINAAKNVEMWLTEPKYAVHFKPGKELREQVNASKHISLNDVLGDADDDDEA